jgi:hypothetical protein
MLFVQRDCETGIRRSNDILRLKTEKKKTLFWTVVEALNRACAELVVKTFVSPHFYDKPS